MTKSIIVCILFIEKENSFFDLSFLVLQPLNVQAKLQIAKTAEEQHFQEAVLNGQIHFEEIYLNINRNQVIHFNNSSHLIDFQILVFGFT